MRRLSNRGKHRSVKFGDNSQGNYNGSDLELSADEDYDSFEEETLNKMTKIEQEISHLKTMYVSMVNKADMMGDMLNRTLKIVTAKEKQGRHHRRGAAGRRSRR